MNIFMRYIVRILMLVTGGLAVAGVLAACSSVDTTPVSNTGSVARETPSPVTAHRDRSALGRVAPTPSKSAFKSDAVVPPADKSQVFLISKKSLFYDGNQICVDGRALQPEAIANRTEPLRSNMPGVADGPEYENDGDHIFNVQVLVYGTTLAVASPYEPNPSVKIGKHLLANYIDRIASCQRAGMPIVTDYEWAKPGATRWLKSEWTPFRLVSMARPGEVAWVVGEANIYHGKYEFIRGDALMYKADHDPGNALMSAAHIHVLTASNGRRRAEITNLLDKPDRFAHNAHGKYDNPAHPGPKTPGELTVVNR